MNDFSRYPERLRDVLEAFAENPADRNQMLIEYSDQFEGVPERIARRPYPQANQVRIASQTRMSSSSRCRTRPADRRG